MAEGVPLFQVDGLDDLAPLAVAAPPGVPDLPEGDIIALGDEVGVIVISIVIIIIMIYYYWYYYDDELFLSLLLWSKVLPHIDGIGDVGEGAIAPLQPPSPKRQKLERNSDLHVAKPRCPRGGSGSMIIMAKR